MKRRRSTLPALLLPVLLVPALAFAKPLLGFGIAVSTDGFFSTTLESVKIASVRPGSASEKAGLKVGDVVVEMDGRPIKGANGPALKKALGAVKPGDHVVLKVERAGKGLVVVDIVAGS
ncbi:MAG TPA: PDZ domain-containing protein [Lysobacter sp.]|nr:PDZ domain-containing protein [Lysobacter sp.]